MNRWTPAAAANNAGQAIYFRQGSGPWVEDAGAGLTAASAEYTKNLVGSGWRVQIRTTDKQNNPQVGNTQAAVPDQTVLGRWRPYALADGSRDYDECVRDNDSDLGEVNFRLERQVPRSGEAGTVRVEAGGDTLSLPYSAAVTEAQSARSARPGITASVEDAPGAGFVAAADQSLSIPARVRNGDQRHRDLAARSRDGAVR